MRVISLFSGIGGFDLGFERAGMETVAFVENNPYCQAVLRKHWPHVPIFDDIQKVSATDLPDCDLLCGGFPCQDLSLAGKGAGIEGERSGLWAEFARLIREVRPRYVVVENVPAIRSRGLWRVLWDLAACGYDAEWDCIRASDIGAPHQRDRFWLVAHPEREPVREQSGGGCGEDGQGEALARLNGEAQPLATARALADAERLRPERLEVTTAEREPSTQADPVPGEGDSRRVFGGRGQLAAYARWAAARQWAAEPDVGRVAHGIPARVDRLTALGNALVPQIAEWIGRGIVRYERG